MRHIAFIIGLAVSLAACGQREPIVLKIGDGVYRFPVGAVVGNRDRGAPYVNFDVGRSADGRLTKTSISLEFNELYNATADGKRNSGSDRRVVSVPSVRWITRGADNKNLFIVKRPWGDIVCDRGSIKVGAYLACGTTFIEAGAQWQVLFHHDKLCENKDIVLEARNVLRKLRVGAQKPPIRKPPIPVAFAMKALSYSGVSGVKFRPALLIVNPLNCRRFFAVRENLPWRIRANFRSFPTKVLKRLTSPRANRRRTSAHTEEGR